MATKNNQLGVRLKGHQIDVLDEITGKYQHTQAGLVRLAVDQLILHYRKTGQLPSLPTPIVARPAQAAAAATAHTR